MRWLPRCVSKRSSHPRRKDRRRRDDRGTLTLWSLAICIGLLAIGGLTIDFWRAIAEWRDTAATADAAAAAGASGVDLDHLRRTEPSEVLLAPREAERLAIEYLEPLQQSGEITSYSVDATPDSITVVVRSEVGIFLPRVVGQSGSIDMTVTATADPRPSG